jgi:hypothetical protein
MRLSDARQAPADVGDAEFHDDHVDFVHKVHSLSSIPVGTPGASPEAL